MTQGHILNDAAILAHASDAATTLHTYLGYSLGAAIIANACPSPKAESLEFRTHVVASGLDIGDGWIKNMAVIKASEVLLSKPKDIRNNKPTAEDWLILNNYNILDKPRADEISDKKYFYSVMSALAIRTAINGHNKTAAVLATNIAVSGARDTLKDKLRSYADEHGLSTHAKKWGKAKTLLHNVGVGVLLHPLGTNAFGRAVGSTTISVGTGVGLHDYRLYRHFIRHAKARAGQL